MNNHGIPNLNLLRVVIGGLEVCVCVTIVSFALERISRNYFHK